MKKNEDKIITDLIRIITKLTHLCIFIRIISRAPQICSNVICKYALENIPNITVYALKKPKHDGICA